jgi:hypothetical protein
MDNKYWVVNYITECKSYDESPSKSRYHTELVQASTADEAKLKVINCADKGVGKLNYDFKVRAASYADVLEHHS